MRMFELITDQILRAIEAGTEEFKMPWHRPKLVARPENAITGRPYRGINTLILWAEATRSRYQSGEWATYRQWWKSGAQVRKGERSSRVLFWKPITNGVQRRGEGDDTILRSIGRAFHVFNADQVDGYVPAPRTELDDMARIQNAEAFFGRQSAEIWHGSDSAFYDGLADIISMPAFQDFSSAESYYSVLAHELTHWTGATVRLNRDLSGRFGSDSYAMEELIAELGAAFIAGHLGLSSEPRPDHAAYLTSWLRVLGSDFRAIVSAASRAQAAADYLIEIVSQNHAAAMTHFVVEQRVRKAAA